MFERVVATVLHRYLGKYIQDLDTENLNVGIFGGEVQLSDLKIKPDALYELDLPIEVKVGTIGRINIKIPWGCFSKQCVSVEMEEVYIIAAPITDREYDPEKEKRLTRASNKRKLELLENGTILGSDAPESPNFLENLVTTIMNNLQVFIHNIHIRYEDSVMSEAPFACGLCLQSLSIETTNSKWKPTTTVQSQLSSIYQLVRLDSLSIYCNPVCSELAGKHPGVDSAAPYTWRADMKRGLETFSVRGEEFDFILKPLAIKIKVIVNKSNEARVPKLLVDFVLQDAATQISRLQYLALIELADSFKRIEINRPFRKFHPGRKLPGNATLWWKYAYNGVLEQRVRPYTWKYIETHRKNFKRYCNIYKQSLLKPADTEVKLDLQKCEDELTIADIVIAREHTKFELLKEDPENVRVVEKMDTWWNIGKTPAPRKEIEVTSVKGRGIWTQLSQNEKSKLFEAIGYSEGTTSVEKPRQYIEHKINFTLANCSLSLIKRGHEIMVITLAQFLASLETRPAARAFKVSTRIESFVIEGVTNEHDLVPIITADNNYTGNASANFLSVDFEKNPLNSEANYGLMVTTEPVEIVYHENAISEFISFLQAGDTSLTQLAAKVGKLGSLVLCQQARSAIERCSSLDLNVNAKLPYFVIPELGTLQKGGNLIILDLGQVKASSELQPKNINLDDATQMEIEERLYDRFYVEVNDFQILFCDAGDVWRDSKKLADSEFHLLPKVQLQVACSNSVKPEYKLLPRHKLNVTVTSLKVNVSDRKIGNVLDFVDNLPLPSINTVHVSASSNIDSILAEIPDFRLDEATERASRVDELFRVKTTVVVNLLKLLARSDEDELDGSVAPNANKEAAKMAMLTVDKNFLSSDHSDEEIELWARTVDLPGFDDNVSPNNVITMLLRFIVGEVTIQLCRSCNRVDKPYLLLRVVNVCCDAALMEYGPAVQASVTSVQLVDKLHTGVSGQYLELIATDGPGDVATFLYRKVRSDCPDFKSHFHNVEQSLVLDFADISVVAHREAIVTLNKYMQYLFQKIQNRDMVLLHKILNELPLDKLTTLWQTKADPPIPPGATKFSYSTRIQEIKLKLCDTDLDFLEIKINGLESDCLFKANERMVLQFYLNSVSIDDLSGMTLYPKVLTVEDDKIIQLKYVRHSPRFYKDLDLKKDDVKSDGNLKLQIGRVHLIVLTKMLIDLQHFLEPFVKQSNVYWALYKLDKMFSTKFNLLRSSSTKLHVALDIHMPSLLFPQKASLPDLIIFCPGDLTVENFFKEKTTTEAVAVPIVDNILVRLSNVQLSRGIMTLGGSLEVQEPILEPFSIKIDLKRTVNFNDAKAVTLVTRSNGSYPTSSQLLLYQMEGVVDGVRVNLGQRDLMTILSVWNDNFNNGSFMSDLINCWSNCGPSDLTTPVPNGDEQAVKKLQAFFYHNEQCRKEATMRLTLDSLQLYFFIDCDEMFSSPIRNMNHGLCKLETGETSVSVDVYSDKSLEVRASLQTCTVEDIRKETDPSRKKLFQCQNNTLNPDEDTNISVSSPPLIDSTFKQTQSGDQVLDILVESTRFNLPVSFILEFTRYLVDSLPPERTSEGGLINFGYVGDTSTVQSKPGIVRPPSSTDSTSGYFSSRASCTDDQSGICVSLQLRRPEIVLYTTNEHSLLFQTEILVDYTRHPGRESLVVSLSGLGVMSRHHSSTNKEDEAPYAVLHPCDLELARTFKASDANLKVTAYISFVDVHITPKVFHVLSTIKDELTTGLIPDELDATDILNINAEIEDLWSPKKVTPYSMARPTDSFCYGHRSSERLAENLVVSVPKVRFMFEMTDGPSKRAPMMLFKMAADLSAYNWSTSLQMKATLQMQMSYFNCRIGAWEPLLEPCVEEEGIYRPIEIHVKLFRAKAYLIQPRHNTQETTGEHESSETTVAKLARSKSVSKKATINSEESETSADEQDADTSSMVFIRRQHHKSESGGKVKNESVSLISYPEDSDSDNEEGVMEKLASAISHLFTGDSSDGDASDTNESSGAEPSPDTDEATDVESMASIPNSKDSRPILIKKHSDSDDSGLETEGVDKMATCFMVDVRDRVEITVTPQALAVIDRLHTAFTDETSATAVTDPSLTLINNLMPNSTVTLLSKAEVGPAKVLMTATYDHSDSLPSSPASSTAPTDFFSPVGSDVDGEFYDDGFYTKKVEMNSTAELHSPYLRFPVEPVSCLYKKVTDHRIRLKIPGFDEIEVLCPQRTCNKLHLLQPLKNNTRYYVVLSAVCHDWGQRITLRSPLQVKNETCYALALFYKRPVLESLNFEVIGESTNPFEDKNRFAIVEPDETFNVPLTIAHHCKIYVQPANVENYGMAKLWWQELAGDLASPKDIECPAKDDKDGSTFSLRALCEEGGPAHRPSRLIPKYTIRLLPPLSFNNRLPYAVEISLTSINYQTRVEAGENANVYNVNLSKSIKVIVNVPSYLGIVWSGNFTLSQDVEEKIINMTTEQETEGGNKQLGLSMKVERQGTCEVTLFAPYWIINKTGLPLQLRASLTDVVYEAQGEEPLLFCYRKQRKPCVRLRAYHSSWSSAFSMDAFGTTGQVICKDRERKRKYRILLKSELSEVSPQCTKIISLLPNFIIRNDTKRHLRFMEENEKADLWIDLVPSQTMPFWPETDKMCLFVKFRDSKVVSQHFPISSNHETVLRMDRGGALGVIVSGGGDRPFTIIFKNYVCGEAPVRVDNMCEDLFLKVHQQHLGQVALLSPYQTMLYTWDDPCKERVLHWNVYNKKCKDYTAEIHKDGYGQEKLSFHMVKKQQSTPTAATATASPPTVTAKLSASLKRFSSTNQVGPSSSSEDSESDELQKPQLTKKTRKDKVVVYWVSYLEGPQRVLMFTQDERVAYKVRLRIDAEKSYLEMFLSLKGFGLSLSNFIKGNLQEVGYISLKDSAPLWEVSVAHKWKPLTLELATWIEDRWKQDVKKSQMKELVHVDFEKMHMTKPFYGELRRRTSPGLWLQYRKSPNYSYFECKIHRIQVENQMFNAIFPIVLYCKPLPKSMLRKSGDHPCVEVAILKRHQTDQKRDVFKSTKVLIQEFIVQLDKNFVVQMFNFYSPWIQDSKPSVRIRSDIAVLHQPLSAWCKISKEPAVVIEYIHVSPICLQLSFIFHGGSSSSLSTLQHQSYGKSYDHDFINFIFDALTPSHMEVKGLSIRTTYFERKGLVDTRENLYNEVLSHYACQILSQMHVLVFSLDILGNPYSPVTDFTGGLGELFYEPNYFRLESPDEYSEGLSVGAQMLMGLIKGSSGSNTSLITSGLTDSNVCSHFEDDIRKSQRRRLCLQQTSTVPGMLLNNSRTFEVGIALGMSGLLIKQQTGTASYGQPHSGMQQHDGIEIFFRSIGRGLMGLMTKPTGGVVDCLTMASDGIKRASEMGEDFILRTRQPRHMDQFLGLRPYSCYEAAGRQLLALTNKGHYADSDIYWCHAPLSPDGKTYLLVTLHHVFFIDKCRLWGSWEVEWGVRVDDIMSVPTINHNQLIFKVRQDESFTYLSGDERTVACDDSSVLAWLQKRIEAVMILNMEDKPCTLRADP